MLSRDLTTNLQICWCAAAWMQFLNRRISFFSFFKNQIPTSVLKFCLPQSRSFVFRSTFFKLLKMLELWPTPSCCRGSRGILGQVHTMQDIPSIWIVCHFTCRAPLILLWALNFEWGTVCCRTHAQKDYRVRPLSRVPFPDLFFLLSLPLQCISLNDRYRYKTDNCLAC